MQLSEQVGYADARWKEHTCTASADGRWLVAESEFQILPTKRVSLRV
jgi:hypothetical protein